MFEIIFLFVLALIWIIFAVVQDLRSREIANWLNFSLILFAIGFRFFFSLFSDAGFGFLYQGLIGLGIFFVLGHLMYYARFFAGGDAKLMIALGAILPLTNNLSINWKIFVVFFLAFFFVGAAYIIIASVVLSIKNFEAFKKEFRHQIAKRRKIVYSALLIGILLMVLGFFSGLLFFLGALIFLLTYVYFYTKAVDESCMVRKINVSKLTEGDWLYKSVKVGNKKVLASWDGLTLDEINLIRKKHKEVEIRQGIQFTPVFLIGFLILGYLLWSGRIESLLSFFGI
ncbi:MAG: prepilin peptidase [Nanoarchaeota archaeon]|nr:prepilin peptidase [Nanoarchaeota archaeon]